MKNNIFSRILLYSFFIFSTCNVSAMDEVYFPRTEQTQARIALEQFIADVKQNTENNLIACVSNKFLQKPTAIRMKKHMTKKCAMFKSSAEYITQNIQKLLNDDSAQQIFDVVFDFYQQTRDSWASMDWTIGTKDPKLSDTKSIDTWYLEQLTFLKDLFENNSEGQAFKTKISEKSWANLIEEWTLLTLKPLKIKADELEKTYFDIKNNKLKTLETQLASTNRLLHPFAYKALSKQIIDTRAEMETISNEFEEVTSDLRKRMVITTEITPETKPAEQPTAPTPSKHPRLKKLAKVAAVSGLTALALGGGYLAARHLGYAPSASELAHATRELARQAAAKVATKGAELSQAARVLAAQASARVAASGSQLAQATKELAAQASTRVATTASTIFQDSRDFAHSTALATRELARQAAAKVATKGAELSQAAGVLAAKGYAKAAASASQLAQSTKDVFAQTSTKIANSEFVERTGRYARTLGRWAVDFATGRNVPTPPHRTLGPVDPISTFYDNLIEAWHNTHTDNKSIVTLLYGPGNFYRRVHQFYDSLRPKSTALVLVK